MDAPRPSANQVVAALSTPAPPGAPAASPRAATPDEGGIKETIESILVAFVLAFIFRAFVVEAFVIPTGSMAPTLMGAHMRFTCQDCGYEFTVNYQGGRPGEEDDVNIPRTAEAWEPVKDMTGRVVRDRQGNVIYK